MRKDSGQAGMTEYASKRTQMPYVDFRGIRIAVRGFEVKLNEFKRVSEGIIR